MVNDRGNATCFDRATGDEKWVATVGRAVTSSPVLAGDSIYATTEAGKTSIFKATPDAFELVAENQLGDHSMATHVICDGRIYMRVAHQDGEDRQEILYCLGTRPF